MGVGQQLVDALRNSQNDQISELLGRIGPHNVNEAAARGWTPLHVACYNNVAAVVKLLSIPGIHVNARAGGGCTPIMRAAYHNSGEAVKLLLDHPGVEVNGKDNHGRTAVMWAAANSSTEAFKLLVEHLDVDVDVTDNDGRGLEEMVGCWNNISEEKSKCFEMIAEKRRGVELAEKCKSGNSLEEVRTNVRQQYIDKIDKINVEIEALEEKIKNNTELRDKLEKQNEEDFQQVANLKDITNQLAEDLRKLDFDPDNDASANLEAAREILECPVCMEIMRPPMQIWMCSASHLVCEPCKEKLSVYPGRVCPTCQTERVTLRAYMAENFARTLFKN